MDEAQVDIFNELSKKCLNFFNYIRELPGYNREKNENFEKLTKEMEEKGYVGYAFTIAFGELFTAYNYFQCTPEDKRIIISKVIDTLNEKYQVDLKFIEDADGCVIDRIERYLSLFCKFYKHIKV